MVVIYLNYIWKHCDRARIIIDTPAAKPRESFLGRFSFAAVYLVTHTVIHPYNFIHGGSVTA